MAKFAFVGEGVTDHAVIKNLLIGFFNEKNLLLTSLHPENPISPGGWSNVLNYISTEEFRDNVEDENIDYVIIQIDTRECEDWGYSLRKIENDSDMPTAGAFFLDVKEILIKKIGDDFYRNNIGKFIFAIAIHEIECWLLPFNSSKKSDHKKIVTCSTAIEQIANKNGFSIHSKNYESGKHYNNFSKEMTNNKILHTKAILNPGLHIFIESLNEKFK